mmetsp:Transcript_97597/g.173820  ORF Transcript_97597/g.173820 Transcript_97597/m.173820 type:complete len:671 (-) Transcript_97597:175-2187(-)
MILARALVSLTLVTSAWGAADDSCPSDAQLYDGICVSTIHGDGAAADIVKLCPLANTPWMRGSVLKLLEYLPTLTPVFRMMGLYPADSPLEPWSGDYVNAAYMIIGRILLGLYKTRNKDYVNIPTGMLGLDDYIQLELIKTPHTDPDGAPNFYWFEGLAPKSILEAVFVPMYTCFYGVLRSLGAEWQTKALGGKFDDLLNDPSRNTWSAVLKNGQSKRDWLHSFYDDAHTWDGSPLWPQQMTDFSTYFKKDEWDDQLENAFAFHLIGAHRLEKGSWTFEDVAGSETITVPYRLPLNSFAGIPVRPGLGKYGVDLYFNQEGLPVLLETPDKDIVVRGDRKWQYWKFVWRSSLVTGITLVDHLHLTHYRASTVLSRATRASLRPNHPLRRLLSIFTFGGIFINAQAAHVLLGPNHLLHRASPFEDFADLSSVVPEASEDVTTVPAIERFADDEHWDQLDPDLKGLSFYADGRLFMNAVKKMITKFMDVTWPVVCSTDGLFASNFTELIVDMVKFATESHYKIQKELDGKTAADLIKSDCNDYRAVMTNRLAHYIYLVTAWHRHVGFVGDYYTDPALTSMCWADGEAFGRPRQHMILGVINVFTSTRQPLLKEDYTHLFKGMQPDLESQYSKIWTEFRMDLEVVQAEINQRNKLRKILNINHSPEVLECSVSK